MRRISILIGMFVTAVMVLNVSAQERTFDQVMKEVGPAYGGLKRNLDRKIELQKELEQVTEDAAKNAEKLEELFGEVESFWAMWPGAQGGDAVEFSRSAQAEAVKAAAAADPQAGLAAHEEIGKSCRGCHTTHRERMPDGSFRIKQ